MLLTYLISHVQHKTHSFRNKFQLLKTYHPVLDEIHSFPISLPKIGTILCVLKKCLKINKQRSHLHKTLTILILICTV